MTVRLRAHHLLCLPAFIGEGYSPAFSANLERLAVRLAAGEEALIVEGPDDVCAPCLKEEGDPHCLRDGAARRDAAAAKDVGAVLGAPIFAGARLALDIDTLARLRAAFAAGVTRAACKGCPWEEICSDIAADAFRGARL